MDSNKSIDDLFKSILDGYKEAGTYTDSMPEELLDLLLVNIILVDSDSDDKRVQTDINLVEWYKMKEHEFNKRVKPFMDKMSEMGSTECHMGIFIGEEFNSLY